jgi:hypothetical protein
LLVAVAGAAACGKKGPPLPPLRLAPGPVTELTARRAPDRLELRVRIPAANADGSTPAVVERLEIYRAAGVAAASAPAAADVMQPQHLWRTVPVVPAAEDEAGANGPAGGPPAPGEWVTLAEPLPPAGAAGGADIWRYVAVAVTGGDRRGAPSPLLEVSLARAVPPPRDLALTYDADRVRLAWTPSAEGQQFEVLVAPGQTEPQPAAPQPLETPEHAEPVVFGEERCFWVRAIALEGQAALESPVAGPICETPVDRFPPAAPTDLVAVADTGAVSLVWSAVSAPDLAGYVVLRTDGSGEALRPVTSEPLAVTTFRDTNVTAGTTYTYAVAAVDRTAPPNVSAPSNREVVTAR